MSPKEIEQGKGYKGAGAHSYRMIDHMWQDDENGEWYVHWWCFLPVKTRYRTFHMPNRTCSLKHFARWAISEDSA